MTYALDTNIIIHLLRGTPVVRVKRDEAIKQGANIIIPQFANYEIWRGFLCKSAPAKEREYRLLCSRYPIGGINKKIFGCAAEIYADLWKKRLTVGEIDILIAAFCIIDGYTLVTDNTKHFDVIDGLKLVNWAE